MVLAAAGGTALASFIVGGWAYATSKDLRRLGEPLLILLLVLLGILIVGFFVEYGMLLQLTVSFAACVVFTVAIAHGVNQIRYPEPTRGNAVLTAVKLFLDQFNLFLWLLRILAIWGDFSDD